MIDIVLQKLIFCTWRRGSSKFVDQHLLLLILLKILRPLCRKTFKRVWHIIVSAFYCETHIHFVFVFHRHLFAHYGEIQPFGITLLSIYIYLRILIVIISYFIAFGVLGTGLLVVWRGILVFFRDFVQVTFRTFNFFGVS